MSHILKFLTLTILIQSCSTVSYQQAQALVLDKKVYIQYLQANNDFQTALEKVVPLAQAPSDIALTIHTIEIRNSTALYNSLGGRLENVILVVVQFSVTYLGNQSMLYQARSISFFPSFQSEQNKFNAFSNSETLVLLADVSQQIKNRIDWFVSSVMP
ncbi:MAG: hypothetical protein QM538_00055 [Methylacidiphilales bacterium]|nr:hypothetical protein [Candidatus Methylacidiphilales bacterium]